MTVAEPRTAAGPERDEAALRSALRAAVRAVDAPDVVLAYSRRGRRTVLTGGAAPPPGTPRELLRYELGSVAKTFTALLLAELTRAGTLSPAERVLARLPLCGPPDRHRDAVTLLHLATHTAGLPRLPADFYPQALPRWRTNPYAGYSRERLLAAFARGSPRHPPGSRWHYSNYGVALLGQALAAATGTPYDQLLARRVLRPLGLGDTGLASAPGRDATGRGRDGVTALPPFDAGGFAASAGIRATPGDLLTFLEAHLSPESGCPPDAAPTLRPALLDVQEPLLRRGLGHRHTHTLTWFRHPTPYGPLYFHPGATMGQEVFVGFRPATGTALAALATRRHTRAGALTPTAYQLLLAAPEF